jgi:predicted O-methyltransferase YrrM
VLEIHCLEQPVVTTNANTDPDDAAIDTVQARSIGTTADKGTAPGRPPDPHGVMALLEGVDGWFSRDQVARVAQRAAVMPPNGCIVEIGSFRGRSTIAMARAAPETVSVYAIDPHAGNDRGPQEITGFEAAAARDHEVFQANLARANVAHRVTYVRKFSHEAHGDVPDGIDLLHIDGAHRFGPARSDIRSWGDRVVPGGAMLIHDAFSSVGVTLAILSQLLLNRRWRYVGRSRSLAEYARDDMGGATRAVNVARQLAQLPWFGRNIAVKTLMVLRLNRLTRLLGHDARTWPY